MKHYFAAAGALLLGTSTIALAADVKPLETSSVETAGTKVAVDSKSADAGWDKSALTAKSDIGTAAEAKVELAALDKNLEPLALAETGKVETASVDTFATAKAETVDTSDKWQTASAETVKAESTAMGGPFETAGLTPRPAEANYPPCDPGPGDDHCIQLYEEGVREQLASWNRPTGGLLDNSATTAMGGPFEPVETAEPVDTSAMMHTHAAIHDAALAEATGVGGPFEPVDNDGSPMAMNGDGSIDALAGETLATEAATTAVAQAEIDQHTAFTGVGGPIEAQSGYPACEPGPGADRCVQLYEAGVSGSGN
jgi:hypothetical protein